MRTETDLANAALSHIGEVEISSIADATVKAARVCNQFAADAIGEVLEMARWNPSVKRTTLVANAAAPISGFDYSYPLPSDYLRLLELNGEQFEESSEFYEVEGGNLLSDDDEMIIRYVARVDISTLGPLLQNAVALRLASKIAVSLTGSVQLKAQMMNDFRLAITEARTKDAREGGNRAGWSRLLGRSRLIRSRGSRGDNPLRYDTEQ